MKVSHSEMVTVLCKKGQTIADEMTGEEAHILHMAVGVAGEACELLEAVSKDDRGTALEECGDIEFYFEGLLQGTKTVLVSGPWTKADIKDDPLTDVLIMAGLVLDVAKKMVIYKDCTKMAQLRLAMHQFRTALDQFYCITLMTKQDAKEHNIEKLSQRYEGLVYSDESAILRADKE